MAEVKEGQEKFITRVQALLAKAESTEFPDERQALLDKADQLILSHQIDRAMLGTKATEIQEGITRTEWEIPRTEYSAQVSQLLGVLMRHCQIRMVWNTGRSLTVIGFESDIEYASMLWVTIYREFAGNLWPTWKVDDTFEANVYRFVKGGFKWADIHYKHWSVDPNSAPEKLSGRYKAAYVRECKRRGEEPTPHTQRHGAFRASYASSFAATINNRLHEMRLRSEQNTEATSGQFALALRSTKERVDEEFYRLFPHYHPDYIAKQNAEWQQREAERRAAMTQEERDAEDRRAAAQAERDRKWYDKQGNKDYDPNGWAHGTRVAEKVDLSMGKNRVDDTAPKRTELHR